MLQKRRSVYLASVSLNFLRSERSPVRKLPPKAPCSTLDPHLAGFQRPKAQRNGYLPNKQAADFPTLYHKDTSLALRLKPYELLTVPIILA